MSLRGHLEDDRTSAVRLYLETVAGIVPAIKRGDPDRLAAMEVLDLGDRPTKVRVPLADPKLGGKGGEAGAIGTAFDYRLRLTIGRTSNRELLAYRNRAAFTHDNPVAELMTEWFFEHLDELLQAYRPGERRLTAREEQLLCRYCVTLARMDAACRRPGSVLKQGVTMPVPWSFSRQPASKDVLLQHSRVAVAKEVMRLSRSADSIFAEQFTQASDPKVTYYPNPQFAGSGDVGGADADLIIGDTLWELKTTKRSESREIRNALLQLVGYCLLDYDDRYKIRNVGVYFPRFEWVQVWPLWLLVSPTVEVLDLAGADRAAWGAPDADQFEDLLAARRAGMKKVAAGDPFDYSVLGGYRTPTRERIAELERERHLKEQRRLQREQGTIEMRRRYWTDEEFEEVRARERQQRLARIESQREWLRAKQAEG